MNALPEIESPAGNPPTHDSAIGFNVKRAKVHLVALVLALAESARPILTDNRYAEVQAEITRLQKRGRLRKAHYFDYWLVQFEHMLFHEHGRVINKREDQVPYLGNANLQPMFDFLAQAVDTIKDGRAFVPVPSERFLRVLCRGDYAVVQLNPGVKIVQAYRTGGLGKNRTSEMVIAGKAHGTFELGFTRLCDPRSSNYGFRELKNARWLRLRWRSDPEVRDAIVKWETFLSHYAQARDAVLKSLDQYLNECAERRGIDRSNPLSRPAEATDRQEWWDANPDRMAAVNAAYEAEELARAFNNSLCADLIHEARAAINSSIESWGAYRKGSWD